MTARNSSPSESENRNPAEDSMDRTANTESTQDQSDTATGSSPGSPITLVPEDLRKSSPGIRG